MQFRKITDEDYSRMSQIQSLTEYDGSEYSMLYLKGWEFFNYESMQICDTGDIIFLRFIPHAKFDEKLSEHKYIYLPPLTILENVKAAYSKIKEQCEFDGDIMYVMSTPKRYAELLGEEYDFIGNRDYDEYLYLPQDLIELSGKKYHSKRNHIKNFIRRYGDNDKCVFRSYQPIDRDNVLALYYGWEENKESDGKEFDGETAEEESNELSVIKLALKLVEERENFFADVVEYEGKLIGFTLGEITPSNVGITHIEKGDVAFDGIYPYLCNSFAKKRFQSVRFINRQEDMGLDGLRQSKLSYHPIGFCEKYAVKSKD
ncbi:MAG: phosphatidylglycerol lysyltransferase domain-containing protein [Clostridia bacterium]|nr:phosphatidylglycerol lysyltransferase domain-containing protein [Clostridia bacterium]MDE7329303.1 phosphatidylglycerol lysyltransferase domain-containing protein [Clostridia bacterium]